MNERAARADILARVRAALRHDPAHAEQRRARLRQTIAMPTEGPRPSLVGDLVGITGASCAIAETGTLMLLSGTRTASTTRLLPETHIAMAAAGRSVADMEEGFALLRHERGEGSKLPRAVNVVSGPSRTGDIEQTVVLGAHGPYRVHLLVVGTTADSPMAACYPAITGADAPGKNADPQGPPRRCCFCATPRHEDPDHAHHLSEAFRQDQAAGRCRCREARRFATCVHGARDRAGRCSGRTTGELRVRGASSAGPDAEDRPRLRCQRSSRLPEGTHCRGATVKAEGRILARLIYSERALADLERATDFLIENDPGAAAATAPCANMS